MYFAQGEMHELYMDRMYVQLPTNSEKVESALGMRIRYFSWSKQMKKLAMNAVSEVMQACALSLAASA